MFKLIGMALLLALIIGHAEAQPADLPAFPGAEGFGALASGGRGGIVLYVTNLNTSGPGSLQEALDTPGKRTIVFAVSGVIDSAIYIRHGDLTIAGQTSPGGIIVRGIICDGHYEVNNCDNLIIRHLRSRPAAHLGDAEQRAADDALRLDGVENVMIDHLSLANASDEAVQISLARNITIQHTILGETVGAHHEFGGMLINYSHSQRPLDRISLHHNLWYRITERLPEIACELTRGFGADDAPELPSFCVQQPLNIEISSNLIWDPDSTVTYSPVVWGPSGEESGEFRLNMNYVNNFFYVRPDFPYAMLSGDFGSAPDNTYYLRGNQLSLYPDYADSQLIYCCNDFDLYHPNAEPIAGQLLPERLPFPPISYTDTAALTEAIGATAGAFPRDAMDQRYAESLRSGIIPNVPHDRPVADDAFALTFDPQHPPLAPLDSDQDGMPDDWERRHGLDPAIQDHNGTTLSAEGYTNLEIYLNLLADTLVQDGE